MFYVIKPKFQSLSISSAFLKKALNLGKNVVGSLLSRYLNDFLLVGTFRWILNESEGGHFGIAVRLIEPFMALYIGAFQMAWGSQIYNWIKISKNAFAAKYMSNHSWLIVILGLPVSFSLAILIVFYAFPTLKIFDVLPFFLMLLSRAFAFGLSSSMGYGQTIVRSYAYGFRLNIIELLLTILLVPLSAYFLGAQICALIATGLPWITVYYLRKNSLRVQANLKKTDA